MIWGPIFIILGSLITAVAPNFWVLLGGQLVAGGGAGLWHLAREIAALGLVRQDQRGRVISTFYGISSAGSILGPVAGGILADSVGFRAIFFAYAGMGLLVLAVAFAIKEGAPLQPRGRSAGFSLGGIREIDPYFRVTFLVLMFGTFAAIMRHTTLNSMLPLYVGTQLGYSATRVGSLFGLMGVVTLATAVPAGFISDKLGRKAATVPAATLSAIAFFGYPLFTGMLALSLFSVIAGIASGLALGSMTTSTYDIVPERARARLQALRRTIGETGSLAGPVVGGVIAAAYTPGAAFLFFAPVHLASALLLAFVAKESLMKRRPQTS
jgi:DHA1 family multidrug resistance protein-like MFS transporter